MKPIRRPQRASGRAGFQWGLTSLLLAAVAGLAWMGFRPGGWFAGEPVVEVAGSPVRRGPLRISVLERGNLKAADAISIKSEIWGQSTILSLVPEGTLVQEGDLVCELDATELEDRKIQQDISVRNAKASWVKSQQNFRIQESQNASDFAKADQKLQFAKDDLRKFRETMQFDIAKADEAIKLAEETYARDSNKLEWSKKLSANGFLTATELEADRLTANRASILLDQAQREKNLLQTYELPRQEAELEAALSEAERESERVRLQAAARIVDYEADVQTNEAKFKLESEKLQKLLDQIGKARILAPRAGMVVYAQQDGGMRGNREPIAEGTVVRERQEIISIPKAGGMVAEAKLHESVLKQVEPGQECFVRIDSIPDREFRGRVKYVAIMADQGSFWSNPNLRVYRTDIQIEEAVESMRPGMSCAVEIMIEEIPDTLYVPVQAVFRSGEETLAFVVVPGGKPQRRMVEMGRYNEKWVQILSGLSEGEEVLLSLPLGVTLQPPKASVEAGEESGPEGGPSAGAGGGRPQSARGSEAQDEASAGTGGAPTAEMIERMRNGEGLTPEMRERMRGKRGAGRTEEGARAEGAGKPESSEPRQGGGAPERAASGAAAARGGQDG